MKISATNFYKIVLAVLIIGILLSIQAMAQEDVNSYKVGERVEYKYRSYPESWRTGTIIKLYPEYKQVLVRWDADPNYPGGYEQAYGIDAVRHIKATTENKPDAANAPVTKDPANQIGNGKKEKTDLPENATDDKGGKGLMTRAEILSYMRTNGYAGGQPKKNPQVCKDLIEQIKRRGVVEPLQPGKDDLSAIADNGCYGAEDTDVGKASQHNIGAPTTLDWLAGTWIMYVTGGTVDTAPGDGYIYRKNESTAKLGFLTINADGTYVWKVNPTDPPAKYVKGTWRKAAKNEMGLQGGAGIVLQKAAEGRDWIVFKYMDQFNKAERIDVQDLQYRGSYRRIGWRK
jgi:hypothetical protein